MKLDFGVMQSLDVAGWVFDVIHKGCDPLLYLDEQDVEKPWPLPKARHAYLLREMRAALHRNSAGYDVHGALRLAGLPDPRRYGGGTELWSRITYVCAPDLHEVEALRAVREAGPDTQDAVAAAYALGGPDAAELLILEVMTTPGGFL